MGFAYNLISNLTAKIVYSTVEGYAFLFSRYGASVLLAGEGLILLQAAGPRRVITTGIKAATICVIGRAIWSFIHATRATINGSSNDQNGQTSATAAATSAAASAAAAVTAAAEATKSIWDWTPPESDAFASGAWFVLRELVRTAEEVRAQNPEVDEIMGRDEMSPTELASRLYYYYSACEQQEISEAYPLDGAPKAPESLLSVLRAKRCLATFAYDCTSDAVLAPALESKGYRLLAAQYTPDFGEGCPAFYLALSVPGSNSTTRNPEIGRPQKEVLLCLRGTYSPEDVFTDLIATGTTFAAGLTPGVACSAHSGMAKAALSLALRFEDLLCSLRDTGHMVTLVGHSLGAGVSSLLAIHLKQKGFTSENLRCFAYEPPACVDLPLAMDCADVVTSVVHEDDCVPRLAMGPFTSFLQDLAVYDWRKAAESDGMPAALSVMHHLAGLFGAKEATKAAEKVENQAEAVAEAVAIAEGASIGTTKGSENKKLSAAAVPADPAAAVAAITSLAPKSETSSSSKALNDYSNTSMVASSSFEEGTCRYNPYPPGKIVFITLPTNELDGSKAVRALLEPSHPVVRTLRLTSHSISDHFIDKPEFLFALGEVVDVPEKKE